MSLITATLGPTSSPLKGIKESSSLTINISSRHSEIDLVVPRTWFLPCLFSGTPLQLTLESRNLPILALSSLSALFTETKRSLLSLTFIPLAILAGSATFAALRRRGLPRLVHRRNPRLRLVGLQADHREGSLRKRRVRRGIAVECWGCCLARNSSTSPCQLSRMTTSEERR